MIDSKPKIFIGPMTKNVVDGVIEFSNETNTPIGLIPSRRQVEWNGGYVNNWTTEAFAAYVKAQSNNLLLVRDHAGPGQGTIPDSGYESLSMDVQHLEVIHIDPWKKYPAFRLGLKETIRMIRYCYELNPNIQYEIATEEAIRRFEPYELDELVCSLKSELAPEEFEKIKYLVIQSGTSLKGNTQTGSYDSQRLLDMLAVAKKHGLVSKEHNGDYIPAATIHEKFNLGLDSINIAPEFGLIETQTYLDYLGKDSSLFDEFWQICYKSNKWVKWVTKEFDPIRNKTNLIKICGHYVISTPEFLGIKNVCTGIDEVVKQRVKYKLNELYTTK
jgi:hypothetical protein